MVIPMKGQYEQQCNAAALKRMDVPVLKKLKLSRVEKIKSWIKSGNVISVDFPDITAQIIDEILDKHSLVSEKFQVELGTLPYSYKKLKRGMTGNILNQTDE
jgi:hypothetical protein